MSRHTQYPKPRTLKILQLNTQKSPDAHDITLQTAFSERIDIVLIQEPYIFRRDLARQLSKRHSGFDCFSPFTDWETAGPPRALTYVRKGAGLQASQVSLEGYSSRDIVSIKLASPQGPSLLLVNVYNAPIGSRGAGEAIDALFPRIQTQTIFLLAGTLTSSILFGNPPSQLYLALRPRLLLNGSRTTHFK